MVCTDRRIGWACHAVGVVHGYDDGVSTVRVIIIYFAKVQTQVNSRPQVPTDIIL